MRLNLGIVGFGYWGKNLVRNFNNLDSCDIKYVCEKDFSNAQLCKKLYKKINVVSNYSTLLEDESIDAIVIATPVDTHFTLSKKALNYNKHVLVEKPLTSSYKEALELVSLAENKNKLLMVDHTFLYTGAVIKIKELVEKNKIGEIQYLDSTRINLGLFQHDVNVLWDLAPHDISICNYILDKKLISVQAVGVSHTDNKIENIAYLTLKYENNIIAHFNCSWVSPVKIRQMLIGGTKKMVVYNDMEPTEKIKIYDSGYSHKSKEDISEILVDYRTGDINVPKININEALTLMAEDFINCVNNKSLPVSNALLALEVVAILDAAERSINSNSKEISFN
ncbi:MAG: oxidoreductase [Crocinitomicaceae bacterium]|nr:oxidoreductase [Crocinitomicaceae bacterium]|tara:strand:- start:11530 stop:12540 length:1011 start_codon:yes stop_codon:yes gene_type:complete